MLAPSALVATGPERAERRRGHPGGRRLAVGAGHDDRAAACAELAQDRSVQRHRDEAADHRACAAAGHPRRPACGGSGRQRDTSTSGDHSRHFRCPTRGISGRGLSGSPCHPDDVSHTADEAHRPSGSWGRPAAEPGAGWAVVDVETSGLPTRAGPHRQRRGARPRRRRQRRAQRLQPAEPRCRPRAHPRARPDRRDARRTSRASPTSPAELIEVLRGRTLVAHNVGFDYSFLAAEAELAGVELPIDTVDVHRRTGAAARPRRSTTCGWRRWRRTGASAR